MQRSSDGGYKPQKHETEDPPKIPVPQTGTRAINEEGWRCPVCGMKLRKSIKFHEHILMCPERGEE